MGWTAEPAEAFGDQLEHSRPATLGQKQQHLLIHAALDQVPVGVIVTDSPDDAVVMMNLEAERLLGISRRALANKNFFAELEHSGGTFTRSTVKEGDASPALADQGSSGNIEYLLTRPDKSEVVVAMSSCHVHGDEQGRSATIVLLVDETASHQREAAFRSARDKLEAELTAKSRELKAINWQLETIFNTSSESLWVCDGLGNVISINRATEKLLGVEKKDVVGKHIDQLVENGLMDESVTRKVLKSGEQTSMIQHTLKTKKQLLVTGTPVFDDDGRISMVIVNERDLTQLNQLQDALQQAKSESKRFQDALTELHQQDMTGEDMIASSKQMRDILMISRKLAAMQISNILILGESGTGKSLLAKYIHKIGNKKGPLVTINCAALPESLLEAELFGYEKGAFTGARDQGKIGLFELANNGTLFLDEIGEMPLELQAKLLHCLEEKEIMHLGGLKPIKINCNIIAATNLNLAQQINNKTFRKDLFFRLNTFSITIPPLRDRKEDILDLSLHLLKKYNKQYGSNRQLLSEEIMKLQNHPLPGNVRELKSIIKKMIVLADTDSIDSIMETENILLPQQHETAYPGTNDQGLKQALAAFEKRLLMSALKKHSTTRALARHLRVSQSQVVRKLADYNLSRHLHHGANKTSR